MRGRLLRHFAVAGALLLAAGCATVKSSRVRPDWEESGDQKRVIRLKAVVQPLPDGNPKVGELWSVLIRRYVNHKRDFIVKEDVAADGNAFDLAGQCTKGIQGVLWVVPTLKRQGEGMEASAVGRLLRCPDGQEIWMAEGGGSWPLHDNHLKEVTQDYVQELGPQVEPYVAPSFNLLRPLLDTLPEPVLSEQDKDEKIELGE